MSQYSILIPASKAFVPGLKVFFKSFAHYHQGADIRIVLLNYDLPDEILKADYPFELKIFQLHTDERPAKICKLASYEFMAKLNGVIMLADADSFFLGNIEHLFKIAEQGYIVGSANGQNIYFQEEYAKTVKLDVAGKHQYRTIAAPYFADCAKWGWVFKAAVDAWHHIGENHGTSIWQLFNAVIALNDLQQYIVTFPAQQLTNLHQKMLKPGTRIRYDKGRVMTEDGLEVLMCHDKWWKPEFLAGLITLGVRFCKGDRKCLNQWQHSRDILKTEFDRWGD